MDRETCIDESLYKINLAIKPIDLMQKITVKRIDKPVTYFDGYAMSFYGFGGEDNKFDIRVLSGLKHYGNTAYIDECGIPCIAINLIPIEPCFDYDIRDMSKNIEERIIIDYFKDSYDVLGVDYKQFEDGDE